MSTKIKTTKAAVENSENTPADKPKRVVVRKTAAERLAALLAKLDTFEDDKDAELAALQAAVAKLRNKATDVTPEEADDLLAEYASIEEAEAAAAQAAAHLKRVRIAIKVKSAQPEACAI